MYKKILLSLVLGIFYSSVTTANTVIREQAIDSNTNISEQENINAYTTEPKPITKKDFFVKLSVGDHLTSSQNTATDLTFSAMSGLAYWGNINNVNNNGWARLVFGYGAMMTTIVNHELAGHGTRIIELNGKIKSLQIGLLGSGSIGFNRNKPFSVQERALISLGGIQGDYLLSQKLINNLIYNQQKMDPVTAVGYFFSYGDQVMYAHTSAKNRSGHDLNNYTRDMEILYGDKSMSMKKIRKATLLDLLDPMLIKSIYSAISGNDVEVSLFKINNVGFTPFINSALTPYGVIEKNIGSYIFTDYTPIRISYGFGKQSKTSQKTALSFRESVFYSSNGGNSEGVFNGISNNESIKNYNTYRFDLSIFKLFSIDKLNIGMDFSWWRQPKLFTADPYKEKPKNGGMLAANGLYKLEDGLNLLMQAGYKTDGFSRGQHLKKTLILNLGAELRI